MEEGRNPRDGGCACRGVVLLIALVNSVRVTLICQEKQAESHHEDWKKRVCEAQVIWQHWMWTLGTQKCVTRLWNEEIIF